MKKAISKAQSPLLQDGRIQIRFDATTLFTCTLNKGQKVIKAM